MKKKGIIFASIIILIFVNSCTKDSNPVNSDTGGFVPNFDNTWFDINDSTHTFSLQQSDRNVTHGLFFGIEDYPDSNIFDANIIGVFNNREIEFNSRIQSNPVKFIGTITSDTTMDLTYFGIKITIKKQNI